MKAKPTSEQVSLSTYLYSLRHQECHFIQSFLGRYSVNQCCIEKHVFADLVLVDLGQNSSSFERSPSWFAQSVPKKNCP